MVTADANQAPVSFADHFRRVIEQKGLGLREVSRRSGVNEAVLSRIVSKGRLPSIATAIRIARGLGISIGELLPDNLIEAADRREASS